MAQIQITLDSEPEAIAVLELLMKMREEKIGGAAPTTEGAGSESADGEPDKKSGAKKSAAKERKNTAKDVPEGKTERETPSEPKAQTVTLTDVRAVALKLSKAGKQQALKEIFARYDAEKLSDIAEENYESLMADLEAADD